MHAIPHAVVFDLDGTLVDSYGAIAECYNHACTTLGKAAISEAAVRRLVGHGLESLMEQAVGVQQGPMAVRLFRERYDAICERRTTLLPGVSATVAALAAHGLRLGVATNKPEGCARRILTALSLAPPVTAVAGPGPDLPPKPDPALLLRVVADLGVIPEQALYVGDMDVDVQTARRAGVRVWVLPTGSSTRRELEAVGADRLLDRFADLIPALGLAGRVARS
jgi:phosphoglycolate phosphatase